MQARDLGVQRQSFFETDLEIKKKKIYLNKPVLFLYIKMFPLHLKQRKELLNCINPSKKRLQFPSIF